VRCEWTQDLRPVVDRTIQMDGLVELHLTLDKDHPIADASPPGRLLSWSPRGCVVVYFSYFSLSFGGH
jgi:hypothetical protein